MTFQFLCPQGHLLQGEEEHMGMQCECPQCGTAFIIPTVEHPATATQSGGAGESLAVDVESLAPIDAPTSADAFDVPAELLDSSAAPGVSGSGLDARGAEIGGLAGAATAEEVLHIPCPNGHELETPITMVGQRAQCPQCGVQFRLRREKSVEYHRHMDVLDRKRARFWFQLSIMAASFVTLVLLVLIAMIVFS